MARTAKQRGPIAPPTANLVATMVLAHPEMTAQEIAEIYGIGKQTVQTMADLVSSIDLAAVNVLKVREPDLQTVLGTTMALESLKMVKTDPRGAVSLAFGAKLSAETRKALTPEQTSRPGGMVAFIEHLDNRQVVIQGQTLKPASLDTGLSQGGEDAINQGLMALMSDNDHSVNQAPPQVVAADGVPTTGVGGGNLSSGEDQGAERGAETIAEE